MLLQEYLNEIRILLKIASPRKQQYRPGDEPKPTRRGSKMISVYKQPEISSDGEDEDESEMGGYGYFDVGSMAKLISKQEKKAEESSRGGDDVAKAARRRAAIGRRLRLAEY
jgi:hypothetical protein